MRGGYIRRDLFKAAKGAVLVGARLSLCVQRLQIRVDTHNQEVSTLATCQCQQCPFEIPEDRFAAAAQYWRRDSLDVTEGVTSELFQDYVVVRTLAVDRDPH